MDLKHHQAQAERFVRQGATRWALVHVCQLTGRETAVMAAEAPAAEDVADFVAGILAHVDGEAAVYAGPQVYHLRWSDERRQVGRQLIRVDGRLLDAPGTGHYPPTAEGVAALALQHAERKDRAMLLLLGSVGQTFETVTRTLTAENKRLAEQVGALQEHRIRTVEVLEDARDRSAERAERLEAVKASRELNQGLLRLAGRVAPELAGRLLGGAAAAPSDKAAPPPQLDRFIDSLTDEQLETLRGTLDPEQQRMVLELIEDRAARREAETTNANAAAPPPN